MNNEDINLNRKGKLRWHSEFKKKKKKEIGMAMVYLWHKVKTILARVEDTFEG